MKNKRSRRTLAQLLTILAIACVAMFAGTITASAAGLEPATVSYYLTDGGASEKIEDAAKVLQGVGKALAGLAIVILGIVIMGGGGQGLQKGKGMAISICVGAIIVGAGLTIAPELF